MSVYYIVTGNKNICELISTEPSGVKYDGETATMKRIFEDKTASRRKMHVVVYYTRRNKLCKGLKGESGVN